MTFEWTPHWEHETIDESCCRASVADGGRGVGSHQCRNKAKYDGKWCGTHRPGAAEERAAKRGPTAWELTLESRIAEANERKEQRQLIADMADRCDGYQGSRDYAIEILAGALDVDADKVIAVEYYATKAAGEIERLQAIVARMHHTADGVPVFGNDRIYYPPHPDRVFSVAEVELLSSFRVSDCYSTRELADKAI